MYLFLVTTLIGFLSVHVSVLTKYISKIFNRIPQAERTLLEERRELLKQQAALSVSRDFVKHSKLQRKINAIDEQLKESGSKRNGNNFIYNIGINYGCNILLSVVMIFLSVYYRKVPVFIVETKYNLWPFGGLISFPNDVENSVSVHFWMVSCSSVARLLKN
ncbi:guided entry of tail-anchored proteins factor 1 [Atheta coriaria]|uniref:guided entry of tail-anchored proteins factor 1 n=1 Tax=Dalotia coriaria TaxID=877792 RepID=UPI0031F3549A